MTGVNTLQQCLAVFIETCLSDKPLYDNIPFLSTGNNYTHLKRDYKV